MRNQAEESPSIRRIQREVVGERILDRFEVETRLGSGGFGTVYRAWDERLDRPVAVKVVERTRSSAPRSTREAQAAARLSHRSIATLYELLETERHAILVGELIEGRTLAELAREGMLSDRGVAEIGAEAAAGLAHAHRHGVVHRDVKPQNLMVPDGSNLAKLVDFGVARVADHSTLTRTGAVIGTLAYMAPEQADGLRAGPSADVYSLALTLYEAFSGVHPMLRAGPAATARAIGEPVPSLAEHRPDLPEQLTELIGDALEPDPEQRPLASELADGLHSLAPELSEDRLPAAAPLANDLHGFDPDANPAADLAGRGLAAAVLAILVLSVLLAPERQAGPLVLLAPLIGALSLLRPRPAVILSVVGSATWLIATGLSGGAFMLLVLFVPVLALRSAPARQTIAAPAAPIIAAAGLGPAYPALAAAGSNAITRAALGAAGYFWVVATELASGRRLLLGQDEQAASDWAASVGSAISNILGPLIEPHVIAGALVWGAAALILPMLVRGRSLLLEGTALLLWSAALVALTRTLTPSAAAPGGLIVVVLLSAAVWLGVVHSVRRGPAVVSAGTGRTPPIAIGP